MIKTYFWFLFCGAFIFLNSCCSSKTTKPRPPEAPAYKELAKEKYGENVTYRFSQDTTYVLCIKQLRPTKEEIYPSLKYFVYDLMKREIIHEENLPNGEVKWINAHQIQVTLIPGFDTPEEKTNREMRGYIYDVKLRRKVHSGQDQLRR